MREAAEVVPHTVLGVGHEPLERRCHCVVTTAHESLDGEGGRRAVRSSVSQATFSRPVSEKSFAIAIKWRALYDSNFSRVYFVSEASVRHGPQIAGLLVKGSPVLS